MNKETIEHLYRIPMHGIFSSGTLSLISLDMSYVRVYGYAGRREQGLFF